MESDLRYFTRRLAAEMLAAKRAITAEARERHLQLAEHYERRLKEERQRPTPRHTAVAEAGKIRRNRPALLKAL